MRSGLLSRVLMALSLVVSCFSCAIKPKKDELTRLEEVRSAAENAERKLAELRDERIALENALAQKEQELKLLEKERDELRSTMESQPQQGGTAK